MLLKNVLRLLGQLYALFWGVILTALLSVAAYFTWHVYQEERLLSQLKANGNLVTVQVQAVDAEPRALWDKMTFSDVVYLKFSYRNQSREVRFVEDTLRPQAGDRITLVYNPAREVFGKPLPVTTTTQTRVVSRLVDWSGTIPLADETKALLLFAAVAVALFFVGGGLLVPLLGHTVIQPIAKGILLFGLVGAALFSTFEVVEYYRYVDQLQRNGRLMEVVVLDTHRTSHGRRTSKYYTYEAAFRFNNQERVISIDKEDFERLNAQDPRLSVLYDAGLNDFIAANYSHFNWDVLGPLLFQVALALGILLWRRSKATPQPARS